MSKFLDERGLAHFWDKIKTYIDGKGNNFATGSGSDSAPIGSLCQFLGYTAPEGYLALDGATYNISDYPELAVFFETQFGRKHYFGGNGTTTFKVPDFRNLFLRGYHGDASKKLSGNIGAVQDATKIPSYGVGTAGNVNLVTDSLTSATWAQDADDAIGTANYGRYVSSAYMETWSTSVGGDKFYTSRPINTAVLICIKAKTIIEYVSR